MPQSPTLSELAHRLLIVGFDGHTVPSETLGLIAAGVGGVILFARNVASPEQVAELNRSLKSATRRSLISSVDQEGGRVARMRSPWTEWPSMRQLGRSGDVALAEEVGRVLGVELKSSGFDLDYAPVLDVDSNPANPVIGDRSFGNDPALVGRMGAAITRGLQAVNVAACGKHFPGHGDTSQDSHIDLPRLPHGLDRLEQIELPPFARAIEAGVASIMTAHVVFEALDPGVPATMSKKVIDGLLRRKLGFGRLIISDDLEMKAVHERFPLSEVIVQSLLAGVDAFLVCQKVPMQHEAVGCIVRAVESGRVPLPRVQEAAHRVEVLAEKYACRADTIDPSAAARLAGSPHHRAVANRVRAII